MADGREQVWSALLAHRDRAVRVAAARCGSREEAEDVVQEAFARIAAMPDVDVDRIGPLLSSVVANLAADLHRARTRASRHRHRLLHPVPPVPEDVVCEKAEARWLWTQRAGLSAQDRRVLELRAAGYTLPESAAQLGITYRAAENALGRARRHLRAVWRATAGLLGAAWARRAGRAAGVASAVPAAVVLALSLGVLPYASSAPGGGVTGPSQAVRAVHATNTADHAATAATHSPRRLSTSRSSAPRARPTAGASAGTLIGRTPVVRAGRAEIGPVPVTRNRGDETLAQTLRHCVDAGVSISLTRLGCPR